MMFKHIKYAIYGCEVSFEVELLLHLKLSFKDPWRSVGGGEDGQLVLFRQYLCAICLIILSIYTMYGFREMGWQR